MKTTYSQLSIEEREKIQKGLWQKQSIRTIASELGRSPSSISREINRNLPPQHILYTPRLAHQRARLTIKNRGKRLRLKSSFIRQYVITKLRADYSPEQIAGRLRLDHPGSKVSPEAIYQYIYAQYFRDGFGACHGLDLRPYLKRYHRVRKRKHRLYPSEVGLIPGRISIEDRPVIVDQRTRFGDWEGDSLISRKSLAGLNSLVERKSGLLFLSKLTSVSKSETTKVVITRLKSVPSRLRQTLTFDNGKENAGHKDMKRELNMDIYFAHAYCSSERATNENTNGLVRHYLPKGTDFATVSERQIKLIERKLNSRPRKRLKFKTPLEVFKEVLH